MGYPRHPRRPRPLVLALALAAGVGLALTLTLTLALGLGPLRLHPRPRARPGLPAGRPVEGVGCHLPSARALDRAHRARLGGHLGQAERLLAEAERIARLCDFRHGLYLGALERGALELDRLRPEGALVALEEATARARGLADRSGAEAAVDTLLGELFHRMLDDETADFHYRRALAASELSPNRSVRARLHASLHAYLPMDRREEALEHARRATELAAGADPATRLRVAAASAASLLLTTREGGELLTRARQVGRQARRQGFLAVEVDSGILEILALRRLGRPEEARRRATAVAGRAALLADPDPRRTALQLEARLAASQGLHGEAAASLEEVLASLEAAWTAAPGERLRRDYQLQAKIVAGQLIASLDALAVGEGERAGGQSAADRARRAFDVAEASRGRSLLARILGRGRGPAPADALHSRRQGLLRRISRASHRRVGLLAGGVPDPARIEELEQERARLAAELIRLESSGPPPWPLASSPLTATAVQREWLRSRPRQAILLYHTGIESSFLIALTVDQVRLFPLPDEATLGERVGAWRQAVVGRSPGATPIAEELYGLLVEPAAAMIRGRDLWIIPDGPLHGLAFEALIRSSGAGSEAGRPLYLIEEHTVSYAPSVSVLAAVAERARALEGSTGGRIEGPILLVGDARFAPPARSGASLRMAGLTAPSPGLQRRGRAVTPALPPLPESRREVEAIAALSRRRGLATTLWVGPEAREENLKSRDLTAYGVLHIATHAVADVGEGGLSSLVLSGAESDASEDGVLTAAEVAELRLEAALVVLSGCETVGGEATGSEGVEGLTHAFLVAGASRVMGTLWNVEDGATRRLMTAFYQRWLEGDTTPARALAEARRAALGAGLPPADWAPFVLIGED